MNHFPAPISKFPPIPTPIFPTCLSLLIDIYIQSQWFSDLIFPILPYPPKLPHILIFSWEWEQKKSTKSTLVIADYVTNNWTKPKNVCEIGWNSSKMLIVEFNSKFVSNQTRISIAVKQHFVCAHKFCWTEPCSPLVPYLYPHSLKWSLFTKLVFDANKFLSSASEFEKQIDETWNSFDWKIATT